MILTYLGFRVAADARNGKAYRANRSYAGEEVAEGLFCYVRREVCNENVSSLARSAVSGMYTTRLVWDNDLWIATILATTLPFVGYGISLD